MRPIRYPWYEARKFDTLPDMLEQQAQRLADGVALEFIDPKTGAPARRTYREFRDEVRALAAALDARGLGGGRVAVLGENSYDWVLAFFALSCGGAVPVPLNHKLPRETTLAQIAHVDAAAVFHDADFRAAAEESERRRLDLAEIPALVGEGRRIIGREPSASAGRAPAPEDAALILYTSGTTEEGAKGVLITHGQLMRNAYAMARTLSFGRRASALLPLFFSGGILFGVVMPYAQGATAIVYRGPMELYDDLRTFRPVSVVMPPMALAGIGKRLAGRSPEEARRLLGGELTTIITGSAPADPALDRPLAQAGARTLHVYGLTEICGVISCIRNEQEDRPGSVGMPLADVPMRIDRPDDKGEGEVLIGAEYAMREYYGNPEATAAALRDGWLHTGDIGRFDDDGYLYITGRIKNLIILSNGENICPEELEAPLMRAPCVEECRVHEDGDALAVTVYPGREFLDVTKTPRDELLRSLRTHVDELNAGRPLSRRIGRIFLSEEPLPKAGWGKIKRF